MQCLLLYCVHICTYAHLYTLGAYAHMHISIHIHILNREVVYLHICTYVHIFLSLKHIMIVRCIFLLSLILLWPTYLLHFYLPLQFLWREARLRPLKKRYFPGPNEAQQFAATGHFTEL